MCGGQVARHQVSVHLFNPSGEKESHYGLGTMQQKLHLLACQILPFFFPLSPEIIVFVSQLPLMMQPCFAAKVFGNFRINIKKEIEKAIESV